MSYVPKVAVAENVNVTWIGAIPSGNALGVAIDENGQYAYVAATTGLLILDVSNPGETIQKAFLDLPGEAYDLTVDDNIVYLADPKFGMRIIDVTNKNDPNEISNINTPGEPFDVAVSGDYAYVADDWGGLRIIDVSNPTAPDEVGYYDTSDFAFNVAIEIEGGFAYVVYSDDYSYTNGSLRKIDINNPTYPQEVKSYSIYGAGNDVAVVGNYAYVAAFDESHGNQCNECGLNVIELSELTIIETGSFISQGLAYNIEFNGDQAYVIGNDNGMRIIDISNPYEAYEILDNNGNWYDQYGVYSSIEITTINSKTYAYLGRSDIDILDVSQLNNPIWKSELNMPSSTGDITVEKNSADQEYYLYSTNYDEGLNIYALTGSGADPISPQFKGQWDTESTDPYDGSSYKVAVADEYAFVAHGEGGIHIIDVINPENPQWQTYWDLPDPDDLLAWGVVVVHYQDWVAPGGPLEPPTFGSTYYVYVTYSNERLRIFEVTTFDLRTTPIISLIGIVNYGTPESVAVEGDYAFLADGNEGLRVVDIREPAYPLEVGNYDTPGYATDVKVRNNIVYVADCENQLQILQFNSP